MGFFKPPRSRSEAGAAHGCRVAIDCEDCFLREDFGGLGLLGPRTAHAGGIFGSMRSSGLLWPSLGWRLALQGVCGLGIRGLLWGFRFQKTSGVASHLHPPVLFVISPALHGATAKKDCEVVPSIRKVLIELQRLHEAGLQGSGAGVTTWRPFCR